MVDPDETHGNEGPATDRHNEPVVDPTKNVLDLVSAAIERQDDLRGSEERHVREILKLRDELQRERTGRVADQVAAEARVTELRAELSAQAISKSERAQEKQFDEFSKSMNTQIGRLVEAVGKLNVGAA